MSGWNVAFRTDASTTIGTGHLLRAMALAGELRERGARTLFLCRRHRGDLHGLAASKGFPIHLLREPPPSFEAPTDPPNAGWLGVPWEDDAEETRQALRGRRVDWLVVDHYGIDHKWETAMRGTAARVMAIDDLADRRHDCDLLLDQNFFTDPEARYRGLVPESCQTLLGCQYALLRPEFRAARRYTRARGGGVGRVFIYFGGHDAWGMTRMALQAFDCASLRRLPIDAVVGPAHPGLGQLSAFSTRLPNLRVHIQPDHFIELMLRADLAIGAGGSTTWERLCLGLPSIVVTVADNQVPYTRELDKAGHLIWLGMSQDADSDRIRAAVIRFTENPGGGTQAASASLVDGEGVSRVVSAMMGRGHGQGGGRP